MYALELNWLDEPNVWKRIRYLDENDGKVIASKELEEELARKRYPQNCKAQFRVVKVGERND